MTTAIATVLRERGHYDLKVRPGSILTCIADGLYRLVDNDRHVGWVERHNHLPHGWRIRAADDPQLLPGIHNTRRKAAWGLLELAATQDLAEHTTWPVLRVESDLWHLFCTRVPCPSRLELRATTDLDAVLAARDLSWLVDDVGMLRCPRRHQFLGGLS